MTAWTRTLQSLPRGTNVGVVRQRREWVAILKWSRPAWEAAYRGVSIEDVLERDRAARAGHKRPPALKAS